ncbi:MAG: YicC/YloC family endoribonuclease [Bacillota bacterium]|nr:YicC/YloC family endoribonuclease [Bacillota bacterium]
MINSMTGYGRCEDITHGRQIIVEIKSVNHRFFEFSCKCSRAYGFLEEKIKSYLQKNISRGKIDVYVSVTASDEKAANVSLNHSIAGGYVNAMRELVDTYGLKDDLSVATLARINDIFTVLRTPEDEEEVWSDVQNAVDIALNSFAAMRRAEGAKLKEDIENRANNILNIVGEIEKRSPETVKLYRERLTERMNELLSTTSIDQQRILTEAALFADKIAVDEETVRLRSHFAQMQSFLNSSGSVGRKLDFIVQEMNREANTIGSKVQDAELAHKVVDIKAEIEKIREQIQNIE